MRIRDREPGDVGRLAEILVAQQPGSGYPVSLPPGGPADLIVREREVGAWVAVDDAGRVQGHVSVTTFPTPPPDDALEEAEQYAAAHACAIEQIGVISALFTDESVRGQGFGVALMRHATEACWAAGLRPSLDVVVSHGQALRLYERLGWETVGEITPFWLPDGMGPVVTMVLRSREPRP